MSHGPLQGIFSYLYLIRKSWRMLLVLEFLSIFPGFDANIHLYKFKVIRIFLLVLLGCQLVWLINCIARKMCNLSLLEKPLNYVCMY